MPGPRLNAPACNRENTVCLIERIHDFVMMRLLSSFGLLLSNSPIIFTNVDSVLVYKCTAYYCLVTFIILESSESGKKYQESRI